MNTDLSHLISTLPAEIYRIGEAVELKYTKDWSGISGPLPEVVFVPETLSQVADVLAVCNRLSHPVVTQGGMTGLSGGASPKRGEWVLSLERMRSVIELDPVSSTITVEAGVTLQEVHEAAGVHNLVLPVDMGSRGSCTVGGFTATNAGGTQVIQHGMVRNLVLGLDAVLADGTIISSRNKLLKNNAGYDLKQLFIGTEGTLGVITAVTFRLFPFRPARQTALCGLQRFEDVVAFLHLLQRDLPGLKAFELMWADYFQAASQKTQHRDPFSTSYPFYVLCEAEGVEEEQSLSLFEDALGKALDEERILDAVVTRNEQERTNLWAIRDGVSELIPALKPLANFDIGVPISHMNSFTRDLEERLQTTFPGCQVFMFGHVGDGNLHVLASTGQQADVRAIEDLVFKLTQKVNGTITAEHGVGVTKKEWLHYCRNSNEIDMMRLLKRTLDPNHILNPGRIFDV